MKAVAIPYVIALVLGIVVIGLLGYWFVFQGGKTIMSGKQAECDAMKFSYCKGFRGWDRSCGFEPSDKNSFCNTAQQVKSTQENNVCDTGFCTFTSAKCSTNEVDCGQGNFGVDSRKCCRMQ